MNCNKAFFLLTLLLSAATLKAAQKSTTQFIWNYDWPIPPGDWRNVVTFSRNEALLYSAVEISVTADRGRHWRKMTHPWNAGRDLIEITNCSFTDIVHGWVLTFLGLYVTNDSGIVWNRMPTPIQNDAGTLFAVNLRAGARRGFVAGGKYRRSTEKEMLRTSHLYVHRDQDGVPEVLQPVIYLTYNGGASWMESRLPSTGAYTITGFASLDRNRLIAITQGGVLINSPSGQSWRFWGIGQTCTDKRAFGASRFLGTGAASVLNNGQGLLIFTSFLETLVFSTTGWSHDWCEVSRQQGAASLSDIALLTDFDGLGISFDGQLWHTSNRGRSWSVLKGFSNVRDLARMPGHNEEVAVLTSQQLIMGKLVLGTSE